jgi:MFS transporter, PAT family, solute carrier family 33 (acetyl-CoA transportor), member 1
VPNFTKQQPPELNQFATWMPVSPLGETLAPALPLIATTSIVVDKDLERGSQGVELQTLDHRIASPTQSPSQQDRLNTADLDTADPLENDRLLGRALDDSDPDTSDDSQMSKKGKQRRSNQNDEADLSSRVEQNGHATASSRMQSLAGHRRKHVSIDSTSSASQIAHLISRESFSLDDDVPPPGQENQGALKGFWELPVRDRNNFSMLVLLYFLQGIPMGLVAGSVPFLLKSHLSYGQIGVFSLAPYPYSLKLLWSPIVDAVWTPKVGRRKSWILPIQTLSGFGMIWLGGRIQKMMIDAGANNGAGVWTFTWWWFFLVFMCATQDIAVDGVCNHSL